jgi:plastocyanin
VGHRILIRAFAVLCVLAGVAAAGPGGRILGKVTLTDSDGKPVSAEVIVYVTGFQEPGTGTVTAKVAQQQRKFVPDLVAITVGDAVGFPNHDGFLHNVFSQSAARKFDLGSFKKGESKDKKFPEPGVVDVYCNIHPEMAATILVLPNRKHVAAKPDGTYMIDGVPPGSWTVFAYARRATRPAMAAVTVVPGQDSTVDLTIVRGAEQPHKNKFGETYRDPDAVYR